MPAQFNPALVDPSVSAEELEQATADPAAAFPLVDDQDLVDEQFQRLIASVPRTPEQATANLKLLREGHVPIGGVGLCLYDERHNAWNVGALWPNANEAAAHGAPIHRFKSFLDVPRHMSIVFTNGHLGHISHGLGGGLNNTSDYHEPGYNGVATIANTADWCNATDWFGIETVNGVDTWPTPTKPKPKIQPLSLKARIELVQRRERELRKAGHTHRADRVHLWVLKLQHRAAK